jgi:hypothetical protein
MFRSFPWKIFFIAFFAMIFLLFCFPINLFNGEIVLNSGLQEEIVEVPLSLSYFIGIGYNKTELEGVTDFYLLPSGYMLAVIFLVGIPTLIAYRLKLGKKS